MPSPHKNSRRRRKAKSSRKAEFRDYLKDNHTQAEEESQTIRLVREAIEKKDLTLLRKLACEQGLVNSKLRRICWPLLLGLPLGDRLESENSKLQQQEQQYRQWAHQPHRDSHVVIVDVERSLWAFTPDLNDEERQVLRDQLRRLLDSVVGKYADLGLENQVHYYQGLHDVASVLMMELGGEALAFSLLGRLVVGHLRDCTRASLEPVLELLQMLWPLLGRVDPALRQFLRDHGLQPYFALSWFITWFAHDASTLKVAARLFDAFLSCHPLMPLYLGVVVMVEMRGELMGCSEMPEMHAILSHVELGPSGSLPPLDQLLARAKELMSTFPPEALLIQHSRDLRDAQPLKLCVSPWAELQEDNWIFPETPGIVKTLLRGHVSGLQLLFSGSWLRIGRNDDSNIDKRLGSDSPDGRKRPRVRPIFTALSIGSVLGLYAVAAIIQYAATTQRTAHGGY